MSGRVSPIKGFGGETDGCPLSWAGIKEIILPKENEKDLEDVPNVVLEALHIQSVSK